MRHNKIIAVLGWEDRFILGMSQELEINHIDVVTLICYEGNKAKTASNLEKIRQAGRHYQVDIELIWVNYGDSVTSWTTIRQYIEENVKDGESILLNISTMPRDMAWTLMFFLGRKEDIKLEYVYHAPEKYGEWLCKEPEKPHLLLNHSGITAFGKPTVLLILTGYDPDRTQQLVECFEPKLTILGVQTGSQYDNASRNLEKLHLKACEESHSETKVFHLDAYSDDCGYASIKEQVVKLNKFNVIASSLGPKLTTISLYKVWQEHNEIALAYVPTKEYNDNYSTGISSTSRGVVYEPVPFEVY